MFLAEKSIIKKQTGEGPLVVQWLRISLSMQGMQVQSLVRELRPYMPQGLCITTAVPEHHN